MSVTVLGLDIGGANTKAAFVKVSNQQIEELKAGIKHFPIWKERRESFPEALKDVVSAVVSKVELDAVSVTMTAELSDAYFTKREGVGHVLDCVQRVFPDKPISVLDVNGNLISVDEARNRPYEVASANWVATGFLASKFFRNCIVIDVGSTTTSIVPVVEGEITARGKNDLEKLIVGELVYQGALRTDIAAIADAVHFRGKTVRVSSEKFALSGDIHFILGNIRRDDYITETADGRGKSRLEVMARIARVICADMNMISESDIIEIANYVYKKQIEKISDGLKQVYDEIKKRSKEVVIIVTGIGKNFLARKAAERLRFAEILDFEDFIGDGYVTSPAVGIALMLAEKLAGKISFETLKSLAESDKIRLISA